MTDVSNLTAKLPRFRIWLSVRIIGVAAILPMPIARRIATALASWTARGVKLRAAKNDRH